MNIYRVVVQGPTWTEHAVCCDRDGFELFETTDLEVARDYRDEIELSLKKGALTANPAGEYRYYVAREVIKLEEVLI